MQILFNISTLSAFYISFSLGLALIFGVMRIINFAHGELIALGAAIAASCEPCLKYHTKKAAEVGLTEAHMREAIAVGRMVKEASAKEIYSLAEKLIPEAAKSSSCCGSTKAEPAAATGCCGGSATSAPVKEKAGSCC